MSELEEHKTYYLNGQVRVHYYCLNGKRHGEFKSYYIDGQINVHYYCVNGNIYGEYKSHYGNGQLWVNCYYLNGKLHGEYKSYCSNGQIHEHIYFLNDSNITAKLVNEFDIKNLSKEDELVIKLRWGIRCLNSTNERRIMTMDS